MAAKSDRPKLYYHIDQPDAFDYLVYLNGWVDDFIEADVLGCVGVRYARDDYGDIMYDDDGIARRETVYGTFEIVKVEPDDNEPPDDDIPMPTDILF